MRLIAITLLLLSACQSAPISGYLPNPQLQAAATQTTAPQLLLYLGMDDYSPDLSQNKLLVTWLHGQLAAGSSPALQPFLFSDAQEKRDSFWTRVTPGQAWGQGFIPLGESNSGQTPALRNFLQQAGAAGKAPTHLVIGSHGGAYGGILYDYDGDINGPADSLSLQQLTKAIGKGFTGSRLASLHLDACMMLTIEVGEALKGVTAVLSGSQDYSLTASIPWQHLLQQGVPSQGESWAKQIVSTTIHQGTHGAQGTRSLGAIRLNRDFDSLIGQVDRLAQALRRRLRVAPAEIMQAARTTPNFSVMRDYEDQFGDFYQRDLGVFCRQLQHHSRDPIVQQAAANTLAAIQRVVVAEAHMPQEQATTGLSIFLPHGGPTTDLRSYRQTRFARGTQWDEFLAELNGLPAQP